MTHNERVRNLKIKLEHLCEELQLLANEGVQVQFNIVDCKLKDFKAMAPMKWEQ